MSLDFVEAFLSVKPQGRAEHVRAWLEQEGLSVVPIRAGFVLTGTVELFNRVFGCDVSILSRPTRLEPPAPIADEVELIEIPRPRYPMSGHQSP